MKELIVADSTCLIGLERIGRLNVLPELFEPILFLNASYTLGAQTALSA